MADYIASCRSNYFQVKDAEKFKAFCKCYDLELITCEEQDKPTLYGFMHDGSVPSCKCKAEGEWVEADFYQDLANELAKGEVAVVMEVGSEKMRYLCGDAVAVNSKCKTVGISLNHIYAIAKRRFRKEPTLAEY